MPLLVIGIYLGLRRSLAPVTHIAQEIQGRSTERLDPISTTDVPAELRPIVLSVNQLLAHIEASFEREKRFTADAAHELRTPLTALKTHAQVALRADEDLRRSSLHKIVNVVNRTNRLLSQLLMLARLDPRTPKTFTDRMNLRSIAQQVIDELATRNADGSGRLNLQAEEDVLVRGEADTLGVLMRNVIENSLQYSAQDQPVDVRVYRDGDRGVFEVEDHGPGIRDVEKMEVFRRFWRAPGTPGFGTGLGLSIVQRIVDLHGGSIGLRDARGGAGLLVSTRFPCEVQKSVALGQQKEAVSS
jgi:two-component system sensor histidine kinase QseC